MNIGQLLTFGYGNFGSVNSIIMLGLSTNKANTSIVNYLITGPNVRNINFDNKLFKIEVLDDIEDDLNITLTTNDLNGSFIPSTGIITNDVRYFEFYYIPSEVGYHKINATCSNATFVSAEFRFLSTSSDPEEGLHPRIEFEVDFNLDLNLIDTTINYSKSVEVVGTGQSWKQGQRFVLYGSAAIEAKKIYVNGPIRCLKIIS